MLALHKNRLEYELILEKQLLEKYRLCVTMELQCQRLSRVCISEFDTIFLKLHITELIILVMLKFIIEQKLMLLMITQKIGVGTN